MDAILNYIAQWLAWIAQRIIDGMMGILTQLTEWLSTAFQRIFAWFEDLFNSLAAYFETVITGITDYFNALLTTIHDFAVSIWEGFQELTTFVMDSIYQYLENAWSELRSLVESIVSEVSSWLDSIAQGVLNLIDQGLTAILSIVDTVKTTIISWTETVLVAAEQLYQEILQRLNTALDAFLGGVGSFINSIESRLSELREAFGEAASDVVKGITDISEEYLAPIIKQVTDFLGDLGGEGDEKVAVDFVEQVKDLTAKEANPEQYKQFLQNYWSTMVPQKGIWAVIFFMLLRVAGSVMLFGQLTGIQSQVFMQGFAKVFPYQIFTPADVTLLWRRGLVSESFAIDTIQRQGYDAENSKLVLRLSDQVPQEGDLLHLWHRGLLDEPTLDEAFHQKGYSEQYRDGMKSASELIPPISDLIMMAVREAFSPEVAERFGQYEDYPPELTEWARKQALTEDWSKRYWAAHWSLPSPYQGFQMLHRGVINEDDLNLLLRALDVMPFWRDRLTQIAYTPFTRVDIRRMHKVGVLSKEDVHRSYMDIGYSEDKAKLMTDFVMLLNEPPKADDEGELKTLSRASIINFYSDGLIQRVKALDLLLELGYSANAANLYLDSSDLDAERANRKASVTTILSLVKAGIITFVEAEDRLNQLGLETKEITKAIATVVQEQERATRLPSRSEAEKMTKLGIISMKEYKDFLKTLGYASKWQDAFASMIGKA